MIFKRALAEKAVAGEKTVTRRLVSDNPRSPWFVDECGYRAGQVFTINPGRGVTNIGRARVLSVRREELGRLDDAEARREGFPDAAAFEAGFDGINGGYTPEALVWRLEFEAIAP